MTDAEQLVTARAWPGWLRRVAGLAAIAVTDTIHKFKLWDKTRVFEAFAKHFGLVKDRIEVTGWEKLAAQLNHARTSARPR